jgi:hypothetical protein
MDREEREKFDQSIKNDPPEATPDNFLATFARLAGEADMIFRRGLVNAFSRLSRDYKSNDGFKIGERTVLTWGVSFCKIMNWFRFSTYAEEVLRDVDRVVHVLDGKPAPEYQQGLCAALRGAMQDYRKGGSTTVETPYWRARFFKNGNLHLWLLRDDLRTRANKLIAEHFGEVIGAGHEAKKGQTEPEWTATAGTYGADDVGFFPTPRDIAEQVIAAADLELWHTVLEPSAGDGALAILAAEEGCPVDCVEISLSRAQELRDAGKFRSVRSGDFLEWPASPDYDRVIMNPPFAKGQDARHVMHALKFVRPGGRLVAIMSAGIRFRGNGVQGAFRDALERRGLVHTIEDLPEGAFKDSGTMVRTVLVTIDVPEAAAKAA